MCSDKLLIHVIRFGELDCFSKFDSLAFYLGFWAVFLTHSRLSKETRFKDCVLIQYLLYNSICIQYYHAILSGIEF